MSDSLARTYHLLIQETGAHIQIRPLPSYALAITNGTAPSANLDVSFFEGLGLQGYVPASQRGTVTGTYSNSLSGQPVVIGFKASAQISFDFSGQLTILTSSLYIYTPFRTQRHSTGLKRRGISCNLST